MDGILGWIVVIAIVIFVFLASNATFAPTPTPTPAPTLSNTEQHLTYATTLRGAIDSFEDSRNNTSEKISEISTKINGIINENTSTQNNVEQTVNISTTDNYSDTKIEISSLAQMWETEWIEVHNRFGNLRSDFQQIGTASESYFQELDKITEAIKDAQIKATEQEKNQKLREEWDAAYTQASSDLSALDELINRGDDFEKILQLAALRATLSENIIQLQEISTEAQNLLVELGQLTVEGRRLILGQSL